MRANLLIYSGICLLLASGCALQSPAGPSPGLDEAFTLAPAEQATIMRAGLRIEFAGVSGDSRCPADAICIQGGDAIVHVNVRGNGQADYELHTGDASRGAVEHAGFRIELVSLDPYPFSSRTIAPDEYRATLRVTR